ncbi:hypothetical protein OPQ81_001073 [Rhizoctonia solani]|nr:hypothetical protein OPQ81_001073 [Rhizoctonia solani]
MLGCGSVNAESIELLREMTVLYFDLRILYEPAYTACSSSACQPAYILSLGQPMHQDVDRENPLLALGTSHGYRVTESTVSSNKLWRLDTDF